MGFEISDQVRALNAQLQHFMDEHIYPREREWHEWCHDPEHLWEVPAWYDDIRDKAKAEGLWNLFLPHEYEPWSPGLTNVEIAPLFETMSKVMLGPGSVQLQCPGSRQHGSAGEVRHARATGAVAEAAACG